MWCSCYPRVSMNRQPRQLSTFWQWLFSGWGLELFLFLFVILKISFANQRWNQLQHTLRRWWWCPSLWWLLFVLNLDNKMMDLPLRWHRWLFMWHCMWHRWAMLFSIVFFQRFYWARPAFRECSDLWNGSVLHYSSNLVLTEVSVWCKRGERYLSSFYIKSETYFNLSTINYIIFFFRSNLTLFIKQSLKFFLNHWEFQYYKSLYKKKLIYRFS
jgi:hypothetical protein